MVIKDYTILKHVTAVAYKALSVYVDFKFSVLCLLLFLHNVFCLDRLLLIVFFVINVFMFCILYMWML